MRKWLLITFVVGIALAVIAVAASFLRLPGFQFFMITRFVGYLLIMSAAAVYLITLLRDWSREVERQQ
ncbi:hypothetical protein GA0116948_11470 [Chitinophaga costaii]|uniref:Uncharacterized protein n=1 Tax=Chitinophaga costaii TaxID=1335309 RepID=A0A1C4FHW5_9BACT|nr:hypothetical protein [Chitinophaga costaii]PUZ20286.1 hypothetical protein DCM91_19135 [Chitinophaga costaii]SCC55444.1 hypothetical protein GA0116948_11470 [Chitinophaga costaii]